MRNIVESNQLMESYAAVMCAVMKKDGKITEKEKEKFFNFYKQEFMLDELEIEPLFKMGMKEEDIDKHLKRIKELSGSDPYGMMRFMQYLNETIISDGIDEGEYAIFESIRKILFNVNS